MIYFKKCIECGQVIPTKTPNELLCCGLPMQDIIPNTTSASPEKHLPTYEIKDEFIYVKVNHPMEKEHHINWIMLVSDNDIYFKDLKQDTSAIAKFIYVPNSKLYAYCNLHGLWEEQVK